NVRIVLIADLHSCIFGENQQDMVDQDKKQEPDMIALTGEINDDKVSHTENEMHLDGSRGTAPFFNYTANHAGWTFRVDEIKDMIRGYGVTVLEQSWTALTVNGAELIICGVDDPYIELIDDDDRSWEQMMHDAFDGLDDVPGYRILLAHRPERFR